MSKKCYSNILQQDCYVRDIAPCTTTSGKANSLYSDSSKYISLDEVVVNDGIKVVETVNDYPITKDYVNSFEPGVNYKNNISECINSPARGVNIPDLTNVSALGDLDSSRLAELYFAAASVADKYKALLDASAKNSAGSNGNSGVEPLDGKASDNK